jgi:hypothetical protein
VYYWNKANFEGLVQVADALAEDPQLLPLAEYCRQREHGLRRKAFETLELFIASTKAWELAYVRDACQRILEIHARTPEAHQFLAQPLLTRFIFPVLDAWVADEPSGQTALRWLGILRRDRDLLEKALVLSPEDAPARRCLVGGHLSHVDYATHHLVEGVLLGDLDSTKQALADARAVAEAAPDPVPLADVTGEIERYAALLRDWESYCESPEGTFPDWCAQRGRSYQWPTIVYYDD